MQGVVHVSVAPVHRTAQAAKLLHDSRRIWGHPQSDFFQFFAPKKNTLRLIQHSRHGRRSSPRSRSAVRPISSTCGKPAALGIAPSPYGTGRSVPAVRPCPLDPGLQWVHPESTRPGPWDHPGDCSPAFFSSGKLEGDFCSNSSFKPVNSAASRALASAVSIGKPHFFRTEHHVLQYGFPQKAGTPDTGIPCPRGNAPHGFSLGSLNIPFHPAIPVLRLAPDQAVEHLDQGGFPASHGR